MESNPHFELLRSAAVRNLFTRCQRVVRKPIRYVTIHFQDRSSAASLRCKNRAEITDPFVKRSPIPILLWMEAKCPYTERNITIEEAVNTSPNFCLKKTENGQYALKEEHVYWQVQGERYFSRRKFCYFVVWTSKDVVALKIAKDEA